MRFTLWGLFLFISALGVYLAMAFATPPVVSIISLTALTYVMGPVAVTGVVYDRGYARTFWIGCAAGGAFPYLIALYHSLTLLLFAFEGWGELGEVSAEDGFTWALSIVVCHAIVFSAGFVAAMTRWLIDKKNEVIERQSGRALAVQTPPPSVLSRRVVVEMESAE